MPEPDFLTPADNDSAIDFLFLQEQFRQSNPHLGRPDGDMQGNVRDDGFDDGDEGEQPMVGERLVVRFQDSSSNVM